MKLYKIKIKPLTSYASLLQSDTFFGAFCWSYKYLYGSEALESYLKSDLKDGPQLIFSNAFPSDCLPLPMGSYDTEWSYNTSDKALAREVYQNNKKLKKRTLIKKSTFQDLQNGERYGYSEDLREEQLQQIEVTHNMINRDKGIVTEAEDGGGNLFVKDEFPIDNNTFFDVYILSSMDPLQIAEILKLMFELGIGASKSTGKGHFMMVPFENGEVMLEEKELLKVDAANGYIALSNFIPATYDPTKGWYKVLVKYGKLDREYSSSEYPFKKPLLFIQAGAVFQTDNVKQYYGQIMTDISAINGVVVNACTIALPMHIPEEVQ